MAVLGRHEPTEESPAKRLRTSLFPVFDSDVGSPDDTTEGSACAAFDIVHPGSARCNPARKRSAADADLSDCESMIKRLSLRGSGHDRGKVRSTRALWPSCVGRGQVDVVKNDDKALDGIEELGTTKTLSVRFFKPVQLSTKLGPELRFDVSALTEPKKLAIIPYDRNALSSRLAKEWSLAGLVPRQPEVGLDEGDTSENIGQPLFATADGVRSCWIEEICSDDEEMEALDASMDQSSSWR